MGNDLPELLSITDPMIENAATDALRAWAEAYLPTYSRGESVAHIELGEEVTAVDGTLTAIDKLLTALRKVYADRGPRIRNQYSALDLEVWRDDDSLRHSLRRTRDEAVKAAAEAADES